MAENTGQSTNYDQLVAGGVIPAGAKLTAEELKVIGELTAEEVKTLVQIRGKLHDERAAKTGKDSDEMALSESGVNPNFIV